MTRIARWAALFAGAAVLLLAATPRLFVVEPSAAKPGDEVVAKGESLGPDSITRFFLTAGGKDIPIAMADQSDDAIRFVIPEDTEHGSYRLMVQTAGPAPSLLEQPVLLEIVSAEELERRATEQTAPEPAPEETEPLGPATDR